MMTNQGAAIPIGPDGEAASDKFYPGEVVARVKA